MVGKEVRDAVVADHVPERGSMCPGEEGTDGKGQADVRLNNLPKVLLVKHDRGRRKVVGVGGVVLLTTGVADEVERPSEQLLGDKVDKDVERRI